MRKEWTILWRNLVWWDRGVAPSQPIERAPLGFSFTCISLKGSWIKVSYRVHRRNTFSFPFPLLGHWTLNSVVNFLFTILKMKMSLFSSLLGSLIVFDSQLMIILFVLESRKLIPLFVGSVKSMHLIPWLRVGHMAGSLVTVVIGHALSSRFIYNPAWHQKYVQNERCFFIILFCTKTKTQTLLRHRYTSQQGREGFTVPRTTGSCVLLTGRWEVGGDWLQH